MNYIQQAYKGQYKWYYWLITIVLVFFGWQILGAIPLLIVAFLEAGDLETFTAAGADNFMTLGINKNLFLFLMLFTFVVGLIFLLISVKFIHKRSITSLVTSRKKIDWKRFFTGFLTWGTLAVAFSFIGIYLEPEIYTFNFNAKPFFILVAISILILPLQTSLEELLFRGYFMQGIGISMVSKRFPFYFLLILLNIALFVLRNFLGLNSFTALITILGISILQSFLFTNTFFNSNFNYFLVKFFNSKLTPLIITSVCFGLLHGANPEVQKLGSVLLIFYIGTGFFYGISTLMDEGTELALGLHAANNMFAAFLVTTDWMVFQTDALYIDTSEPSVSFEMFFPVFILYPLLLFFFSKKYKWTNWKEKLTGKIEKPFNLEENYRILDDLGTK